MPGCGRRPLCLRSTHTPAPIFELQGDRIRGLKPELPPEGRRRPVSARGPDSGPAAFTPDIRFARPSPGSHPPASSCPPPSALPSAGQLRTVRNSTERTPDSLACASPPHFGLLPPARALHLPRLGRASRARDPPKVAERGRNQGGGRVHTRDSAKNSRPIPAYSPIRRVKCEPDQ